MGQPQNTSETLLQNLLWFVLAGAALGVAFLVQSPYMAFSLYAFLLLVALAHFSSLAWVTGLECERTISKDMLQQGEEAEVQVRITNRYGIPIPWVYIEDWHPPDFQRVGDNARLAVLMPGQSVQLKYTLTFPRRGYHRIGPTLMESGDLFGLQKRFRTARQQNYVAVLPTVAYIDTFQISAKRPQGPVKISNRVYEDPTRIVSVREYVRGDPMNRIHWKVSARADKLYVKQAEPSNVLGATLALDLHDDSYLPEKKESRMELAITTTASIAYLLQMSGEQVGMITNALDAAEIARYETESRMTLSMEEAREKIGGEGESDRLNPLTVPTRRSPIQARVIIENLARVVPGAGLEASQLILSQYQRLPRDATLLPVVPAVSEELALVLGQMKYSGFSVSVFLIDDFPAYGQAVERLGPYHINVFHIEHERSLYEIAPERIGQ